MFKKVLFLSSFFILSSFNSPLVKKFPTLELKSLEGQNISLSQIFSKNQYTVIDLWATWCGPCKKELDALKTYYDEWKKQGVEVVAITIDDSQQINKVKPMIQQKGWKYTILSDVNKLSQNKLGYSAIPMTYIVNKSGDIVYSHNGYTPGDENELAEKVKELLK